MLVFTEDLMRERCEGVLEGWVGITPTGLMARVLES